MKVGIITKTNQKGQIVIPKEIREALGIDHNVALNLVLRGKGIYIYPVEEVITKVERESSFLRILQKTQGSWKEEDWKFLRKRKKIELSASKKRKRKW